MLLVSTTPSGKVTSDIVFFKTATVFWHSKHTDVGLEYFVVHSLSNTRTHCPLIFSLTHPFLLKGWKFKQRPK